MLCHGLSSSALLCPNPAAPGKLYSADDPIGGPDDPPDTQIDCMFGWPYRDAVMGISSAIQSQPVWRDALAQHWPVSRRTNETDHRSSWPAERVLHRRSQRWRLENDGLRKDMETDLR